MKFAIAAILLVCAVLWLPLPVGSEMMNDLDAGKVRLGLGLFVCIAFLWMTEAMPLAVTALLIPLLASALGLGGLKTTLPSYAHPLIFVFLGGFALASALSAQGLDRWLAEKLCRLGKGKFLPVAGWLFIGTAFLSMWMSNTATTAMMLPLAIGILGRFDFKESKQANTYFLLLGLAYSSSIGGLGTIIGSPPNGIAAKQLGIGFAEWMRFGIPAVLVLLPAMVGLLWLKHKPQNHGSILPKDEENRIHFNRPRILTLGIFFLTAISWIFSMKLSEMLQVSDMDTWVAIAAIVALASTKCLTWAQLEKGTDWGMLLLFGGGLALSAILESSGSSLFMARLIGSMMENLPTWAIIASVVCFVIFLTELSSNTATAALLVPIFYSMSKEYGLPSDQLILPLALAASCAFMLPVGTPPNAIVFGSGRVPQSVMIRTGFLLNLVFILLITALALVML